MLQLGFALLVCCGVALCQQSPRPAPARMSDAQVIAIFNAISQHMARLEPMLEQVRVKEWVAKGAPDAYARQLSSTAGELRGIQDEMARLSQNFSQNVAQRPSQMQDYMRALFRVQALHVPLDSLMGGLRRYQNPALADLIESVAAEDQSQVAQFENYILQLADDKDQQYQIADNEAQRCRAMLSREPAPRSRATHN